MRMFESLLLGALVASVAACGSEPRTPTSPTPPDPGTHLISGLVSETVDGISRPMTGRPVHLWIQLANGGFTRVVTTDQSGGYMTRVPASRVFATAWHPPDQQQPCMASAAVNQGTTLDIEVRPTDRFSPPPTGASPLITGFVYESTPQGRKPLPGVHISVDAAWDVWVAYTRTDGAGRFFLCRVNAPVQMVISAGNGYQDVWQSIPGAIDMHLEIELRR
jgi:hypothetical protein